MARVGVDVDVDVDSNNNSNKGGNKNNNNCLRSVYKVELQFVSCLLPIGFVGLFVPAFFAPDIPKQT